MDRTEWKNGTYITRGDSRHVLYQVISRNGIAWSIKFTSAQAAARWARKVYPDQEQDEDRTGKGWDVETVI